MNSKLDSVREAVRQLQQAEPLPRQGSSTVGETSWITPSHLLFSNGWAAYKIDSIHEGDGVGDVAVLKISDESFYVSKAHFCMGIADSMLHTDPDGPRPETIRDFLENFAKHEEWNLYSPAGQLRCAVLGPDASYPRKPRT